MSMISRIYRSTGKYDDPERAKASRERKRAEAEKRARRRNAAKAGRQLGKVKSRQQGNPGPKEWPAYTPGMRADFYSTREWRAARYDALAKSDGRCELCGAGKQDGATLHVDHIKPRSRFPDLELDRDNLQVLCADCNLGKGNRSMVDWRTGPITQASRPRKGRE